MLASTTPASDAAARCGSPTAATRQHLSDAYDSSLGSAARPAVQLSGRISVVRSTRHRSMDVSIEYEPRGADGAPQPALRQVVLYEV